MISVKPCSSAVDHPLVCSRWGEMKACEERENTKG